MGLAPKILKAIEGMGFEVPTEVQSRAIPHVLEEKDLIVMSKTGSGKTAVFGIPMLQLIDPTAEGPQGLIMAPTRELAVQVDSDLRHMGKYMQHRTMVVYGQHSMHLEIQGLQKGAAIVTGTPGRVYDHIRQGNLKTDNIRFLVLDEADRMLDMGFIDQVVRIIRTIPKQRVTLLFSATMPTEIKRICREYMNEPMLIEIESETKTVDAITQWYHRVEHNEKRTALRRILTAEKPKSCMVFCNTRRAVETLQGFLTRCGFSAQALHGEIPQGKRMKTIKMFKDGEFEILVATDVAARGIHIDDLALVVNYDVPVEKDSYVHRIGRTGRAGNGGRAITMVTGDEIMSLYEIEEHIGAMIPEHELPEVGELPPLAPAAAPQSSRPERGTGGRRDQQKPRSSDRKPFEKKPHENRDIEKKVEDRKPNERKPNEKKPFEKKSNEKKPYEKKPYRNTEGRPERTGDQKASGSSEGNPVKAVPDWQRKARQELKQEMEQERQKVQQNEKTAPVVKADPVEAPKPNEKEKASLLKKIFGGLLKK